MRKVWSIISFLIGAAILVWQINNIGISKIILAVRGIGVLYMLAVILLMLAAHMIGAANIILFLRCLGHRIRSALVFDKYILTWVIGQMVPIRISSISLIILLERAKVSLKDAIAAIYLDKLITFVVLFVLTGASLIYFFPLNNAAEYIFGFAIVIMLMCALLFSLRFEQLVLRLVGWLKIFDVSGFSSAAKQITLHKKAIILNALLTIAKLIITALMPYVIFVGFGMQPDIIKTILVSITVTAIASLPITSAGLGVREVSAVVLFNKVLGIDSTLVASTYLLLLGLKYIFSISYLVVRFAAKHVQKNAASGAEQH